MTDEEDEGRFLDAEPVAWQWRTKSKYPDGWSKWTEASEEAAKRIGSQDNCEWRALYTASPLSDASAELIEAIDRARDRISAVIYTLEAGVDPANWERNCCIRFLYEALEALAIAPQPAPAQSNAEPVRVTDEMVKAASDVLFERTSIAFGGTYMREALEAALDPKQVSRYTAPPRPDASAELTEAAKIVERYIDELKDDGVKNWIIQIVESMNIAIRAANRSGE